MNNSYTYKNVLINKKQLKQLLAWSFTKYDSMQACLLADELKYLGFKYATQAGISISIEDLKVPFIKHQMLSTAHQEVINAEKICLKGKITDVERLQKIIDTWSITSESLKNEVVSYFKNYDPLNSVYIMAFSGARGNLSQVRQLVGMRGLMSDPSGEILKLPIKKNFREGLTITDYLMSGYGARKGIVDTALKTANSGYLTRRLIDVSQDIIIREKDCSTHHSCFVANINVQNQIVKVIYDQILGRLLSKSVFDPNTNELLAESNTQLTPDLIKLFKQKKIHNFYIRSPLTCKLYRSICQKCYGWDLATENLVDIGEAIGIIAGQSIGEPGTQLTMRTFHTGGIFTSETRQQIVSPTNGVVKFSKILKTITLRTNRGEDVLVTKNSGALIIISEDSRTKLAPIELIRNTILFTKNNQYVKKGTILGELTNAEKQTRTEIKPVLSTTSGEIFIPRIKNKAHFVNTNKFLWLLSGKVYEAPFNSFLNFYTDHKINRNSYIFRTKLINSYSGNIKVINNKKSLFQCFLKIVKNHCTIDNSYLQKLDLRTITKPYILCYRNFKYFINLSKFNSKFYINQIINKYFGTLITAKFKTKIGGTAYYDQRIKQSSHKNHDLVHYFKALFPQCKVVTEKGKPLTVSYDKKNKNKRYIRSIIWLEEETYKLNCDRSILMVEHGNYISKNFEIVPGTFSKTAGVIFISYKNNIVHEVAIRSGSVYQGEKFENFINKVYYPGEVMFNNINIKQPSLCQPIFSKLTNQLLIRPLEIYEIPRIKNVTYLFSQNCKLRSTFDLSNSIHYLYKSNQKIKTANSINLISNLLQTNIKEITNTQIDIELVNKIKRRKIEYRISENLNLTHYIPAKLKYTNLDALLLVEPKQYIDTYTTLGYLEKVVPYSLEVVKLKSKVRENKQLLLISNDDCLTIEKSKIKNKTHNDFVTNNINIYQSGKVIIDNGSFLTIQKGRPYFFPNCETNDSNISTDLSYKILSSHNLPFSSCVTNDKKISLNYYDITKRTINKKLIFNHTTQKYEGFKIQFSKMFIKKNRKIYSSAIPIFIKNFSITSNKQIESNFRHIPSVTSLIKQRKNISLLFKESSLIGNKIKKPNKVGSNLLRIKFFEYPFRKSIGLHSLSADYFEQESNSVFCQNGEFVEEDQTLGLLNFEKEITGDIVQGLPRIEELLEARKKKQINKHLPTNQKKGLLISRTSLDPNFEFKKLGTTVKENEKINPHSLLKIYFHYYGLIKHFFCDNKKVGSSYRLLDNYEASYKTFKKVQSLILNSVQSVYESQGVSIADKHLEVIIKQMTTKVLITHEGNTPLLPREVIDLYHIEYINTIIKDHNKIPAFYVPLLLGVTKASLNNPSFISAASFQETTRVLTKAAIEGRVDWLRGLKENIIIGHLIPAGTGSQNYGSSFRNSLLSTSNLSIDNITVEKL